MAISLPNIGKTAVNTLKQLNITTLNEVSKVDEGTLLKIHGIGPKAIRVLKEKLTAEGMDFSEPPQLSMQPPFAVIGDLSCDNAPKRRVIRDFIIARTAGNETALMETITENASCQIVNRNTKVSISENNLIGVEENHKISSMIIHHNISHGKEGASETVVILNNGEQIHIADFFLFESHKKDSKIYSIKSYVL